MRKNNYNPNQNYRPQYIQQPQQQRFIPQQHFQPQFVQQNPQFIGQNMYLTQNIQQQRAPIYQHMPPQQMQIMHNPYQVQQMRVMPQYIQKPVQQQRQQQYMVQKPVNQRFHVNILNQQYQCIQPGGKPRLQTKQQGRQRYQKNNHKQRRRQQQQRPKRKVTELQDQSKESKEEIKKWLKQRMKNFPTKANILRKRKQKELQIEKGGLKEDLSQLEIKLKKRMKVCQPVNMWSEFRKQKDIDFLLRFYDQPDKTMQFLERREKQLEQRKEQKQKEREQYEKKQADKEVIQEQKQKERYKIIAQYEQKKQNNQEIDKKVKVFKQFQQEITKMDGVSDEDKFTDKQEKTLKSQVKKIISKQKARGNEIYDQPIRKVGEIEQKQDLVKLIEQRKNELLTQVNKGESDEPVVQKLQRKSKSNEKQIETKSQVKFENPKRKKKRQKKHQRKEKNKQNRKKTPEQMILELKQKQTEENNFIEGVMDGRCDLKNVKYRYTKNTLLVNLLAKDIYDEHNILLQALKYIQDKEFFQ